MPSKIKRPSAARIRALIDKHGPGGAADIIGVTPRTLYNWRLEMGMETFNRGPRLIERPPEAELRRLYDEHSIRQLANLYCVNSATMYGWLKKFGIKRRPPGSRAPK